MLLMILMLIQTTYGQQQYNNVYNNVIQNANNKELFANTNVNTNTNHNNNNNERITRFHNNAYGLPSSLKKYKSSNSHIRQPSSPSFQTSSFSKPPNYITKGRNKKPILLSQVLRGETSLPQYLLPAANNKHPSSSFVNTVPYIEADTFTDSHPPPSYESNSLDSPPPSIFYSNNNNNHNLKEHSNKFPANHHIHNHDNQLPTAIDNDFIFPPQPDVKNLDDVYMTNGNQVRTRVPTSILSQETNNDEVILDKVRNNHNNNNYLKYAEINNYNKDSPSPNYNNNNNNNNNKPMASYLDKDIRALFNRIKMQNSYDNNNNNNHYYDRPYYKREREVTQTITTTPNYNHYHNNDNDRDNDRIKNALSKLLIPLLPELTQFGNTNANANANTIDDNDRGKREEMNFIHKDNKNYNNTKIIYVMEENDDERSPHKGNKGKGNGNTVFVVLTPSDFKAATNILSSNDNYINNKQESQGRNNEEAITAPTIENIALQKYIMSLAGLAASPSYTS